MNQLTEIASVIPSAASDLSVAGRIRKSEVCSLASRSTEISTMGPGVRANLLRMAMGTRRTRRAKSISIASKPEFGLKPTSK